MLEMSILSVFMVALVIITAVNAFGTRRLRLRVEEVEEAARIRTATQPEAVSADAFTDEMRRLRSEINIGFKDTEARINKNMDSIIKSRVKNAVQDAVPERLDSRVKSLVAEKVSQVVAELPPPVVEERIVHVVEEGKAPIEVSGHKESKAKVDPPSTHKVIAPKPKPSAPREPKPRIKGGEVQIMGASDNTVCGSCGEKTVVFSLLDRSSESGSLTRKCKTCALINNPGKSIGGPFNLAQARDAWERE